MSREPAEHPQGAECDPPARPALAVVDLDRHAAGVPDLDWPPAVAIALRGDQLDRLGHALVGRHAGAAQVIEAAQHVVVPPRREGKAGPGVVDDLAGRPPAEEAALEEVLLAAEPRGGCLQTGPDGSFVLEQGCDRELFGRVSYHKGLLCLGARTLDRSRPAEASPSFAADPELQFSS